MIRAFHQAQEYIVNLVCVHLFLPQIVMHLYLHLEFNLIMKAAGLSDLFLPLKLLAVTGWKEMSHIPYHTLRISV